MTDLQDKSYVHKVTKKKPKKKKSKRNLTDYAMGVIQMLSQIQSQNDLDEKRKQQRGEQ